MSDQYPAVLSVQVWRELPEGEELGDYIDIEGERYLMTKRELARLRSLPTAGKIREQVAAIQNLMKHP